MSVLIAIPARYASTRYPGKPLVALAGPDGEKTLIRRSWEAANAVRGVDRVVVATDDRRIADHAEAFGAEVIMTSSGCRNGTERCAEVARKLPGYEILVNLQGDAPLTPAWFVEDLIRGLRAAPGADIAWQDEHRTFGPAP
ncbi:MAG: NTP transferase domain-containing protein, partial [Tabrizicola sp.]|nr:NTP transferase domain-containing protein [Tabrizicola sp.]